MSLPLRDPRGVLKDLFNIIPQGRAAVSGERIQKLGPGKARQGGGAALGYELRVEKRDGQPLPRRPIGGMEQAQVFGGGFRERLSPTVSRLR